MKIRILNTILLLVAQQMAVHSQDLSRIDLKQNSTSRIFVSYLFGGQIYNDHFLYNPGLSAQYTQSYKVSKSFEAGLGVGYISMINESFIPIYLEAFGYKNKSYNSPFIKFQMGYSPAWYKNKEFPSDYQLSGGLYFSAGLGRKIRLRNRYSVLFYWSYCHQSGSINYLIFGNNDYYSSVSYDYFMISFGMMRE